MSPKSKSSPVLPLRWLSALLVSGSLAVGSQAFALGAPGRSGPAAQGQSEPAVESGTRVPVLKDADLAKLSKAFGLYFQALREKSGTLDALDDIEKAVAAIEKRLKGPKLLGLIPDLERAMILADEASDNVEKGKVAVKSFNGNWKDTIRYAVQAPKAYRVKSGPYPLLLVIPEEGKAPEVALREQWSNPALLDEAIVAVVAMPGNVADWNSIGAPGQSGGVASVLQTIRELRRTYFIDPNRIYLLGHARAAQTAVEIGSYYPHIFAGVVATGGDLADTPPTNFGNLPALLVGTAARGTEFESAAKAMGFNTVEVRGSAELEDTWGWLREQVRQAHPTKLAFVPGKAEARESYWLSVEGFNLEAKPHVEAEIDRANSVIRLTGEGFTHVKLQLNDELLDLSKPFRVLINGTENEASVIPNLRNMLDNAFKYGDRGRAYTTAVRYEFTSGKSATE